MYEGRAGAAGTDNPGVSTLITSAALPTLTRGSGFPGVRCGSGSAEPSETIPEEEAEGHT